MGTSKIYADIVSCLNVDAPVFVPPISKQTLLYRRNASLSSAVPSEIANLKAEAAGTRSGSPAGYRCRAPSTQDVFGPGKPPLLEALRNEAALLIQHTWRSQASNSEVYGGTTDVELQSLSQEEESDGGDSMDDNSPEAVAVRRAFFTSIRSNVPGAQNDCTSGKGRTYARILRWVDSVISSALETSDKSMAMKSICREWAATEQHILMNIRK